MLARSGFAYQDYWAASFLLTMAAGQDDIREVWLETHDDIVLVRGVKPTLKIEYVQVKATKKPEGLWTVARLVAGGEKSLLAKSLNRDRVQEEPLFTIATLRDVNEELEALKSPLSLRSALISWADIKDRWLFLPHLASLMPLAKRRSYITKGNTYQRD